MLVTADNELIRRYSMKKAGMVFRAINHKLRMEVVLYIHSREKVTVTELCNHFKCEQPLMSYHIGILKEANLVRSKRVWRNIFYSAHYEMLDRLDEMADVILKH